MKLFQKVAVLSLFTILGLSFVACGSSDPLASLENALSLAVEVTDSIDPIDEQDLSTNDVDALAMIDTQEPIFMNLAVTTAMTPLEKVQEIRRLHELIVLIHNEAIQTREEIRTQFEELKAAIDLFKEQGTPLSEEDKAALTEYVATVKEARLSIQAQLGVPFQMMRDLRGKYDLEHVDLVLSTYQDVLDILSQRMDHMMTIQNVVEQSKLIVESYLPQL